MEPNLEVSIHREPIELSSQDGIVTLRQYTTADAQVAFDLIDRNRDHLSQNQDTTAAKYQTVEDMYASIASPPNPDRLRFGIWNVNDGLVGTINLTPDTAAPNRAEVGYYLGQEFTGRGYIGRALATVLDYAFAMLRYEQVYAVVALGNEPSIAALQRAEFRQNAVDESRKLIFVLDKPLTE